MNNYQRGIAHILSLTGLEKTSGVVSTYLRDAVPRFGKYVKETAIGSPIAFGKEILEGKALKPEGMMRESLKAPGIFNKALFYGLPAWSGVGILRDNEGEKMKRIGGLAAGTAIGIAMFKPLGLVGAMAGDAVGQRVGGGLLGGLGNLTGISPKVPTPIAPTVPPKLPPGTSIR